MSEYLASGSYIAILVVLVLTGMGLPVPEEVPIVAAGVLSAHDHLNPWLALAVCIAGALLGDTASYWIGYHFGRGVLQRHRWWAYVVTPERELRLERLIRAHGLKIFFTARFLIGIRSAIYLTAGILRISFLRFILIDALCAAGIISVFFGLSYWFGEQVAAWIRKGEWAVTVVVVVVCLAVGAVALWRYSRRAVAFLDAADPEVNRSSAEEVSRLPTVLDSAKPADQLPSNPPPSETAGKS
jgi:membrane protein DedA with SNARE-associated domain